METHMKVNGKMVNYNFLIKCSEVKWSFNKKYTFSNGIKAEVKDGKLHGLFKYSYINGDT